MSQPLETRDPPVAKYSLGQLMTPGMLLLIVMLVASAAFFAEGIAELLRAWQLPEYSHGPLIPVISALLFLRQLKSVPEHPGPLPDRRQGLLLLGFALSLALAGKLIRIGDLVTYAMILWVGAVLLISFGWARGKHFWPPVLHLIYMLPLPGALYYGVSTFLQGVSSELGVYFLHQLRIPVFLQGNIIDLGVYKLHVAEACSGLRYLFPILSFSYIFAVLYRGPMWHKAVLLLSAVPITVVMNAVRIAIAGLIVNRYGISAVEGFSHFFEGWVIFVICILELFALAWLLLFLRRDKLRLSQALDLETDGLGAQFMRLRHLRASSAMIGATVAIMGLALLWQAVPERKTVIAPREPFALFPTEVEAWTSGPPRLLDPQVAQILAANDYHSVVMLSPKAEAPVDLFMAWYADQSTGGVHSPEVCLPGGGWEIAELGQIKAPFAAPEPFELNRAIVQKGTSRMLVYYWFEQQGNRTASGFQAKFQLMMGKLTNGRNDSALVRISTPIGAGSAADLAAAETRLNDFSAALLGQLPRFIPDV